MNSSNTDRIRPRKLQAEAVDYLLIAFSPALIIGMISCLVFFLLTTVYEGQYLIRLSYILFLYTFGVVLIARIAIEQGRALAMGYMCAMGTAATLVILRFVDFSNGMQGLSFPLVLGFLVFIAFLADRITYDCTIIEDDEDTSGEGLLQSLGILKKSLSQETAKSPSQTPDHEDSQSQASKVKSKKLRRRSAKHNPGVWVVYFALLAIPVFGLGQLVRHSGGYASRSIGFWLLFGYLACALSLLVVTNFLSLRRYLRKRRVQMPKELAATWLSFGLIGLVGLLTALMLLPLPGRTYGLFDLPFKFTSERMTSSRWGWGPEGVPDKSGSATVQQNQQAKSENQGSGNRGNDRPQPAKGDSGSNPSKSNTSNQPSPSQGSSESSKGSNNSSPSSAGSAQASTGGQQSSSQQGPSPQQPSSNQPSSSQSSSSQPASSQPASSQSSSSQQSSSQSSSSQQSSSQSTSNQPSSNQPSSSQQSPSRQSSNSQPPNGSSSTTSQSSSHQQSHPSQNQNSKSGGSSNPSSPQGDRNNNAGENHQSSESSSPEGKSYAERSKEESTPDSGRKSESLEKGSAEPGEPERDDGNRNRQQSQRAEQEHDASKSKQQEQNGQPAPQSAPNQPSSSSGSNWQLNLPPVAPIIKWLTIAALLAFLIYYTIRFRSELLTWIADLYHRLFGNQRRELVDSKVDQAVDTESFRSFSSYDNPFEQSSMASNPGLIVPYLFAAVQAWGREHGVSQLLDETPEEYLKRLGKKFQSQERGFRVLSQQYYRLAYGNRQLTMESIHELRAFSTWLWRNQTGIHAA